MLWFTIIILLWLEFTTSIAFDSPAKIVVLTLRTNPSSIWKTEWLSLSIKTWWWSFFCIIWIFSLLKTRYFRKKLLPWKLSFLKTTSLFPVPQLSVLIIVFCVFLIWMAIFILISSKIYIFLKSIHIFHVINSLLCGSLWKILGNILRWNLSSHRLDLQFWGLATLKTLSIQRKLSNLNVSIWVRFKICDIFQSITIIVIDDNIVDCWSSLTSFFWFVFLSATLWWSMIWIWFNDT